MTEDPIDEMTVVA
jgi:hypothetical protein